MLELPLYYYEEPDFIRIEFEKDQEDAEKILLEKFGNSETAIKIFKMMVEYGYLESDEDFYRNHCGLNEDQALAMLDLYDEYVEKKIG